MNEQRKKEEFLETLWHMMERGNDSIADLENLLGEDYDRAVVDGLAAEGLVSFGDSGRSVELTAPGLAYAAKLIRAHRLAERLIHDALGGESETSACEFEHIINPELVDGICTLLGHPRECPHGMAIPEGECCRKSVTHAESPVVPLTQLKVGQEARIAYVQCRNDEQLHRLEDLQIRPGVTVRLHQTHPSYVIECEGAHIALDRDVGVRIRVWRPFAATGPSGGQVRGFGLRRRGRHGGGHS